MAKRKRCSEPWSVYIVECSNQALYTGIAKDVLRRLATHNAGRGAKYTRIFGPVQLRWSEKHKGHLSAARREAQIKRWPRQRKLMLIGVHRSGII